MARPLFSRSDTPGIRPTFAKAAVDLRSFSEGGRLPAEPGVGLHIPRPRSSIPSSQLTPRVKARALFRCRGGGGTSREGDSHA
jgi:hypothetical protein